MKSHKELDVWQQAIELAKDTYKITQNFPSQEQYGIISQMRRSSVSIASNIAEGSARQGTKEFIHFLYMASGSANELDTQIEISKRVVLGNIEELTNLQEKTTIVLKMLRGLIRSLKQRL